MTMFTHTHTLLYSVWFVTISVLLCVGDVPVIFSGWEKTDSVGIHNIAKSIRSPVLTRI